MDRERKTLAEFSRTYLRPLETPMIVETVLDGDNAEGRFAASVALGMRRAVMDVNDTTAEATKAFGRSFLFALQTNPRKLPPLCGQRDTNTDDDKRKRRAQTSGCDAIDTGADDRRCFVHGACSFNPPS